MSGEQKVLYWRLTPVYPREAGSLASAAMVQCLATGKYLDSAGGGGRFLSTEIVDALDYQKNDGARVIVDAVLYDRMVHFIEGAQSEGLCGTAQREQAETAKELLKDINARS